MQYVYIYMVYKGFIKSKRGLLVRGDDHGSLRMRGFACFSKALTGGRHYDSLGIHGVAHKGEKGCGRHRSTLFLRIGTAGITGLLLGLTGTQEQQEQQERQVQQDTQPDSRIHSWTTGYAAGLQDTWLDYRIHSKTAGYMAGLQDTQPDNRIHRCTTGYKARQQDMDTPQQAQPCNGRERCQTNRSRTEAKTLLRFDFNGYNRNRTEQLLPRYTRGLQGTGLNQHVRTRP